MTGQDMGDAESVVSASENVGVRFVTGTGWGRLLGAQDGVPS